MLTWYTYFTLCDSDRKNSKPFRIFFLCDTEKKLKKISKKTLCDMRQVRTASCPRACLRPVSHAAGAVRCLQDASLCLMRVRLGSQQVLRLVSETSSPPEKKTKPKKAKLARSPRPRARRRFASPPPESEPLRPAFSSVSFLFIVVLLVWRSRLLPATHPPLEGAPFRWWARSHNQCGVRARGCGERVNVPGACGPALGGNWCPWILMGAWQVKNWNLAFYKETYKY